MIGWLWYFVDLHRLRYSHAGRVCFGDFANKLTNLNNGVYLTDEGSFFTFMIVTQWMFLGLIMFGLASSLAVYVMCKLEGPSNSNDGNS